MKFILSMAIVFSFTSSFSQSDSIKNKLTVGICPFFYFIPTQEILYFEYQPKNKFSFEFSGGVYNSKTYFFDKSIIYGFSVRSAIKFCRHQPNANFISYREALFFYRQVQYRDRIYIEGSDTDPLRETPITFGAGDASHFKKGNERKEVMCLEYLWGRKHLFGKKKQYTVDTYFGLGLRIKMRDIIIYEERHWSGGNWYSVIPYNENTNSILPSIHCGVKAAYSF